MNNRQSGVSWHLSCSFIALQGRNFGYHKVGWMNSWRLLLPSKATTINNSNCCWFKLTTLPTTLRRYGCFWCWWWNRCWKIPSLFLSFLSYNSHVATWRFWRGNLFFFSFNQSKTGNWLPSSRVTVVVFSKLTKRFNVSLRSINLTGLG